MTSQPFTYCCYHFNIIVLLATSQALWLVDFTKPIPELLLLSLSCLIRSSDVCSHICRHSVPHSDTLHHHDIGSLLKSVDDEFRWAKYLLLIKGNHTTNFFAGRNCQRFWNSLSNYPIDNVWSLATSDANYLHLKCHLLKESKMLD